MIQRGRKNINKSVDKRDPTLIREKNIIEQRKKVQKTAPERAI